MRDKVCPNSEDAGLSKSPRVHCLLWSELWLKDFSNGPQTDALAIDGIQELVHGYVSVSQLAASNLLSVVVTIALSSAASSS